MWSEQAPPWPPGNSCAWPGRDPSLPWPRRETEGGTWGRSPEQRSATQPNSFGKESLSHSHVSQQEVQVGLALLGRADTLLAQGTWGVNDLAIAHPALWASLASTQALKAAETATTPG